MTGYEEVLVMNNESRNNPTLRKEVSDSLVTERALAAEALVLIEKAQALVFEARRLPFTSGEGVFIERACSAVFLAKDELTMLADAHANLSPDSTYVGNAAARVGARVEVRPI